MTGNKEFNHIEIIDKPFVRDNERPVSKTVVVTIFNNFGKVAQILNFGLLEKETVYEWLLQGEEINLDNCYIKNFSLEEFKRLHNFGERKFIKLNKFSAINTYFDCEEGTDFSFAQFDDNDIHLMNARFNNGPVNFYRSKFGNGDLNFSNAVFSRCEVNFQFSEFEKGNVSFQNVLFDQSPALFVNTKFGDGLINFKEVYFKKSDANFRFAKFGMGNITFDKAIFDGDKVDFKTVEFSSGKVDFKRVDFGDCDVSFEETEFGKGKISFKSSRFGKGNISFRLAEFGNDEVVFDSVLFGTGDVSFAGTRFGVLSFKGCQINSYFDLRVNGGNKIDLSDTVLRDIIDLLPSFYPVDIKELNISGMKNLGKILVDWKSNNLYQLIAFQTETSNRQKAEQFRLLKEDFNSLGNYNDEDYAYVEFKRFELKAEKEEAIKKNKLNSLWVHPISGFKWLVFDKMGLYATNPARVIVSMIVIYSIFSFLYLFHPGIEGAGINCSGADNELVSEFALSFYFSAVTFLTIGYGDCLPMGYIKLLAPLEGWMGMFLMAYFTVAFVRKILR
jgi:hypothetical protein